MHDEGIRELTETELLSVSGGTLKEIFQNAVHKILNEAKSANSDCVDGVRPPRNDNDIYRPC